MALLSLLKMRKKEQDEKKTYRKSSTQKIHFLVSLFSFILDVGVIVLAVDGFRKKHSALELLCWVKTRFGCTEWTRLGAAVWRCISRMYGMDAFRLWNGHAEIFNEMTLHVCVREWVGVSVYVFWRVFGHYGDNIMLQLWPNGTETISLYRWQ